MKDKKSSEAPLFSSNGQEFNRLDTVPPLPELSDPFHPDNLRIDQEFLKQEVAKKALTTVPVRKPNKQHFIRVHPSADYRLSAALIELREDRETYLVHPRYYPQLDESLRSMYTIFLAINRQKVLFLWPVKLPDPGGRQLEWHLSALAHAERAMKEWVRVAPNMSLGAYEVFPAENQTPQPEWPDLPFFAILKLAFKGTIIESDDHPVMQKLRGLI